MTLNGDVALSGDNTVASGKDFHMTGAGAFSSGTGAVTLTGDDIKHMLVDEQGEFSKAIVWVTENKVPKIVCHPAIAVASSLCLAWAS